MLVDLVAFNDKDGRNMASINPLAIFDAEIIRVKTMADGSPRFELGAGEDANQFLSVLANVQADKRLVKVIIYDYEDFKRLEQENT